MSPLILLFALAASAGIAWYVYTRLTAPASPVPNPQPRPMERPKPPKDHDDWIFGVPGPRAATGSGGAVHGWYEWKRGATGAMGAMGASGPTGPSGPTVARS
jgi:hypothetical protein